MSGIKGKSGKYKRTTKMRENYSNAQTGTKKPWVSKRMKITMKGEGNCNWKGGISDNKEYRSWLKNRHYYRKKNAEGSHTFGEWKLLKKQYGYTCLCCKRKEPEIKLTEDHIISLDVGGSDYIENIQPLCKSCNSKKHNNTIKYEI